MYLVPSSQNKHSGTACTELIFSSRCSMVVELITYFLNGYNFSVDFHMFETRKWFVRKIWPSRGRFDEQLRSIIDIIHDLEILKLADNCNNFGYIEISLKLT
eukprot:660282_1